MSGHTIKLTGNFYRQYDADYNLDVPAEGFEGWASTEVEIDPRHTALAVMHAWDTGTPEKYPGWYRKAEFLVRGQKICREVFPPLLAAVRATEMPVFHVVIEGDYYQDYPGYKRAVELAGPAPAPLEQAERDPVAERLHEIMAGCGGRHNLEDIRRGYENLDIAQEAKPLGDEGVAENAAQLFALCKEHGINHLIYVGFAINWCLLHSPGGMVEMKRHGVLCSTLRQAVTAVENKETARNELGKEMALWRVGLNYGFVFEVDDFTTAITDRGNSK